MNRIPMHWQIIIGMVLGVIVGLSLSYASLSAWALDWIKPFGTVFINLLKVVAVPLVFISLVQGISSLSDIAKLSSMGLKTLGLYIATTVIAISIGLVLANVFQPGKAFPEERRAQFAAQFAQETAKRQDAAKETQKSSPLQPLVDIVPENIIKAATENRNMLQVIFFAALFGVALLMIDSQKAAPVKALFDALNDVVIKMVEVIMRGAPYGVFALMAYLIVDFAGDEPQKAVEIMKGVGTYALVVVGGLLMMVVIVYPLMVFFLAGKSPMILLKGILPAQMLAFSTSSSAATLPVTMECVHKNLGVSKEVSSFVLPMGATINMDGTSLYQGVAAIFIAQVYNMDLSLAQQLSILLTATLASVGAAAVPGAGILMLIVVLEQAGIPSEGIYLIFAIDRILDMCRTVVNVTGDASVSVVIQKTEEG
ncbi:dicarboxylate/amino acid:cation symporter [Hugenholtzia roseola]|uniref:dicarboxylate/amino acid:cation symporter n=1 Tax=Hugenholtzia roseola TaxID=1002 RepID=UPI00054F07C9|nr:dicarboxylate/amino acid:cation symporter [Hugenholtzia roseola]